MIQKKVSQKTLQKACFGAGCFWHVEDEFSKIKGVVKTTVGFMGGTTKNPSYEEVCRRDTGHIEVCLVEYDPDIVSFDELLEVFWRIHDPSHFQRQGPDVGVQYSSVIFYFNEKQRKVAETSLKKEQSRHTGKIFKIFTAIRPAAEFYKAEEYHQSYLAKVGAGSCRI